MLPDTYTTERHPHIDLFEDDFVAVAWTQNSLIGDTLTLEQYLSLGHVTPRFGTMQRIPTPDELFASRHNYTRRLEAITYDFNCALQLVLGSKNRVRHDPPTTGYALCSLSAASRLARASGDSQADRAAAMAPLSGTGSG